MLTSVHKMLKLVLLTAICVLHSLEAFKDYDKGVGYQEGVLYENPGQRVMHGRSHGKGIGLEKQRNYELPFSKASYKRRNYNKQKPNKCNNQKPQKCHDDEQYTTKFLLLFTNNLNSNPQSQHLFITGLGYNGTCNISTPLYTTQDTVDVIFNNSTRYMFSSNMLMTTAGYSNKGILVECDVPVNIQGFNYELFSSDGFTVLPVSELRQQYVIPSSEVSSFPDSLFGITTLTDNSLITINVRTKDGSLLFDGSYYANGTTFNITLGALQTAQILCPNCDLSGTFISSSEPIAVVSGVDCSQVESNKCSHNSEMVIPVDSFSNEFAIPHFPSLSFNGVIRIFAFQEASVSIYSTNTSMYHLLPQNFLEISYDEVVFIESTVPVMVQLYGHFFNYRVFQDSFMMTVPGIYQYNSSYTFAVPKFGYESLLSFIVKSEDKDGVRLDGDEVDMIDERVSLLQGANYTSFVVNVSPGYHVATHTLGKSFGLFVVGSRSVADGYGFLPYGYGFLP